MTGIRHWHGITLCGLAALSFGALAEDQAQNLPSDNPGPKWGAHIDLEAKPGSKRNLGEADLFIPLKQNENTLLFANLRGRFDDNSSHEGNFGLGVRRMLEDGWNVGAYGYWDRRHSGTGNDFNQGTLGVEALGRDWDMRLNGYLPFGSKVKSLPSISSAALSGTTVQVSTDMREERALKGFDAEVGWRTPLFAAESLNQLRLYAGGFHFADDVMHVSGPRLRAELAISQVPGLWAGSELFLGAETQHDNQRGGQSFLGFRLRIPFGGKAELPRLTLQEQRMAAPIVRDVDIVSQSRVSSTLVETATATAGGQTITVLSSATTNGDNLDTAVAGASSNVILSGTFQVTGANTISLNNAQSLMAGAISVRSPSGRTATLNTTATIMGTNVNLATVQINSNGTLSGVTVSNAYSGGAGGRAVLVADNAGNVTIRNNTLTTTQSGNNAALALSFGNNTSGVVSSNTLTVTGSGAATTMTALGANLTTTVTVSGNTLSASGGTTNDIALLGGTTTINTGSTGNVRGSGSCTGTPASGTIGFTNGTICP